MTVTVVAKLVIRRATTTEWNASSKVIAVGEWAENTDTGEIRMGQGVLWNQTDSFSNGGLCYAGNWSAAAGTFPAAANGTGRNGGAHIRQGDWFVISVAGTISGVNMEPGDWLVARQDNPGTNRNHWTMLNQGGAGGGGGVPYPVSFFGAVADGVTDNTAALNAAAAAAEITGGVVYYDLLGVYGISGAVLNGDVALQGQGGNGSLATVIRCLGPSASFSFGNGSNFHPTLMEGFVIDYNGTGDVTGRFRHTAVKGTVRRVHCTDLSVSGTTTASMTPGVGAWINGSQNCTFNDFDCDATQGAALQLDNGAGGNSFTRCEISTAGIPLQITDTTPGSSNGGGYPFGPGNNYFHDCIIETRLSDSYTLVDVRCGAGQIFDNCGFSNSTNTGIITSGGLVLVSNDIVFNPLTSAFATGVVFRDCNWNGGSTGAAAGSNRLAGVLVFGGNQVTMEGSVYFQDLGASLVQAAAGAPLVQMPFTGILTGGGNAASPSTYFSAGTTLSSSKQALIIPNTVTAYTVTFAGQTSAVINYTDTASQVQTKLRAISSIGAGNCTVAGSPGSYTVVFTGSLAAAAQPAITTTVTGGTGAITVSQLQTGGQAPNTLGFYNKEIINHYYQLPSTQTLAIRVKKDGETFDRTWIGPGNIAFGAGTANPAVGVAYDSASGSVATSGPFRTTGGRSMADHITTVSSGSFSFTADPTAYPGIRFNYINSACALTTFLLTGGTPVDGQIFTITHVQPTPGGCTYVWPPNVAFLGSIPTENGDGTVLSVTFEYNATLSTWFEISRSGNRDADLPNYVQ